MQNVGYYNGEIGALEEMKIPMLDRAVYFGDGCYDATTFANNKILMPMITTMVCFTGSAPVERHPVIISSRRRR